MDYEIISQLIKSRDDWSSFKNEVNKKLKEGYTLHGSTIFEIDANLNKWILQPLVKKA